MQHDRVAQGLYGEEQKRRKTWKEDCSLSSGRRYGDYRVWIQLWANMTIILTSRLVVTFHSESSREEGSAKDKIKRVAERAAQGKNFHCGGG